MMMDVIEVGQAFQADRYSIGTNTGRSLSGVAGGALGGWAGAAGGAAAGAAFGSVVPIVGTTIGAAAGAIIGGLGVGYLGDKFGRGLFDWFR
jgi:phage tail tape-measure protein